MTLLLVLLGCAATISGEVDGEKVPALSSGLWYEVEASPEDGIVAVATDFDGSCEAFTAFYDGWTVANEQFKSDVLSGEYATALNDYYGNLTDAYEDNFPEEAWLLSLGIVADPDDEQDVVNDYDIDQGEASLSVTTIDDYPDGEEILLGFGAIGDTFPATDGEVVVTGFAEDGSIRGDIEAELVDEEGDEAGDVLGDFALSWCEEAEDAWGDLVESLTSL